MHLGRYTKSIIHLLLMTHIAQCAINTTNPMLVNINNTTSPLLKCEFEENLVYFKFPDISEYINLYENETEITRTRLFLETAKGPDLNVKRRMLKRLRRGGDLKQLVAESKLDFPPNFRFRVIVSYETTKGHTWETHIESFHYASKEKQLIKTWAQNWDIASNLDCFNFTTPFMARGRCGVIEFLYCARQQYTQAIPPKVQINGEPYNLYDEDWYGKQCMKLDRSCHRCRIEVLNRASGSKPYNVCVTDTQTYGAPETWECSKIVTNCHAHQIFSGDRDFIYVSVIGALGFVAMLTIGCFIYKSKRFHNVNQTLQEIQQKQTQDQSIQTEEPNYEKIPGLRGTHDYDELSGVLPRPPRPHPCMTERETSVQSDDTASSETVPFLLT